MINKLKNTINRFLLKIAKQNEELYGKDRMDCCKLNKTNEINKTSHINKMDKR